MSRSPQDIEVAKINTRMGRGATLRNFALCWHGFREVGFGV
ncbi:MAG: hypothetical protein OEV48_07755 [Acidobacteriota bacterium]|nr:hypothetical protein [Acidobacteriota bacterium]